MMSDYKHDNKMVTCPYDSAHRMLSSRIQTHITKCALNHLDEQKDRCPFNATHLYHKSEMSYHVINCPDRGALDRHMAQTLDKNNPYKGNTSVPTFSDPHVEHEESWDLDTVSPRPISYQPPPGAIVEPPAMSKPSERKLLYRNLHQMHNQTQNDDPTPIRKPVPRQPNPVEAPTVNSTQLTDPKTIQNLGLGRGKNRIAANFNNNVSNGNSERSYSNIVKNMSNLGLGRGQSVNPAPAPRVYDDDDDDEYPVLGCGRGAFVAPKQNPRTPGSKKPK